MVAPAVAGCVQGRAKKPVPCTWVFRVATAALLIPGSTALAQVQPVAPTREEVTRPPPDRIAPPRPSLTVEGGIERAPCALDRPDYQDIRFTLNDAVFEDLRGLSAEALRPAFAPFVGQEHPIAILCEIRDRAATILRNAGYVASVEVPEQRIADGTIRFRVLMARLVGLRVRGDAGRAERLIAGYLEGLTDEEVFNRFSAERRLLLASDIPGYSVRLALRSAGTAPGEVIGEVSVQRTPVLVDFALQNYGSRETGRWGGLVRGQFYGLTGLGDRTSLSVFTTADFDEQQTLQVAHDFRLGSQGLSLGGQLTLSWGRPDLGDPAIDFESRTLFATFEAGFPFIRSIEETLRGAFGFDLVNQDVDFADVPFSRDRLRVVFAKLTYEAQRLSADPRYTGAEPLWRFAAAVEVRHGLDIFGATDPCGPALAACFAPGAIPPTRFEADPTAAVLRASFYGEYRPAPRLTVAVGLRGQYSNDPLLSFEEFSGGNYTIGRGYDPGAIVGDRGFGFQAEVRYGSPIAQGPESFAAEPFVFFDQAWAWNEDRVFAVPEQDLSAIGAGVRATYGNRFRLEATLAVPLARTAFQTERGDPRLLISFTTLLWPWSA